MSGHLAGLLCHCCAYVAFCWLSTCWPQVRPCQLCWAYISWNHLARAWSRPGCLPVLTPGGHKNRQALRLQFCSPPTMVVRSTSPLSSSFSSFCSPPCQLQIVVVPAASQLLAPDRKTTTPQPAGTPKPQPAKSRSQ